VAGRAGKRPAARRAGVDVKTASRYIHAAQAAGLVRERDESQLTDELLGQVVAAVRPARPAGHGASWEALVPREAEVTAWVKAGLTLVKIGEVVVRDRIELSTFRFSVARVLDPSRTRTCVALVLAAAARPAVAPAPRTRRPHIGTRARPRPEYRLPPATRRPARYPRGQAGNDPP
jgi:hypothetical protein